MFKIFSFFSGSGFLDLGFEKSDYNVDFINEFSPAFINAYQYSREQMGLRQPQYGYHNTDISVFLSERSQELQNYIIDARLDGSSVGFIGGPPCPDFSVAGKQRGSRGDNGKLTQTYVNLVIQQKPDFFLFENVKGLWRTKKHRAFYEKIKLELQESGYCITERLTNSIEFGLAQDRDRILLFGIRKELILEDYKDKGLLVGCNLEKYADYDINVLNKDKWVAEEPFVENGDRKPREDVIHELTVKYWFDKNDVENHPNAIDQFKVKAGRVKMESVAEGDTSKKSYKRLHRYRYSPTAAYGNNEVHLHPYKVRRISAAEALAIQSLPKEFVLPPEMSLTDKFKTIGNGVPFVMARGIAQSIRDYLGEVLIQHE